MLNRRLHPLGLFAVLLAMMVQLGIGASVPRIDPLTGVAALCHTAQGSGGRPSNAPEHRDDCLACPLCAALNAASFALVPVIGRVLPPAVVLPGKTELPPPATAPPAPECAAGQPRAPPTLS